MTHLELKNQPFFIIDVESIGLHGEGFAVAGGVYINGKPENEFCFSCPPDEAKGDLDDRDWVHKNISDMVTTNVNPHGVRASFWQEWEEAKIEFPNIVMAGECIWPVETNFISACIRQNMAFRKWKGPYPFYDISSIMLKAGMDPMKNYTRNENELPYHDPLADVRLSARLLMTALDCSIT